MFDGDLDMSDVVKTCKKCGPLKIDRVYVWKGGKMRCISCTRTGQIKRRASCPNKWARYEIRNREPHIIMLSCCVCKTMKVAADFNTGMLKRKYPQCRDCHRAYNHKKGSAHQKNNHLKSKFGITIDQYNSMLKKQNSLCDICKMPETIEYKKGVPRTLAVDHNHSTGAIRALLCNKCNYGLAAFREDISIFKTAIKYLRKHNC